MQIRRSITRLCLIAEAVLTLLACGRSASPRVEPGKLSQGVSNEDNRLRKFLPSEVAFTQEEKLAIRKYAAGWNRLIEKKILIGVDPDFGLIRKSFERVEIPQLVGECKPEHRETVANLAYLVLEAIAYGHKARIIAPNWPADENREYRFLLRLQDGDPVRDTNFLNDRMLKLVDDLKDLAAP